jgi:transcription initiation factor TFIID subunit TAF12
VRLQFLLAQQAQQRKQAELAARVAQIRAHDALQQQQQQRLRQQGVAYSGSAAPRSSAAAGAAAAGMLRPEQLVAEEEVGSAATTACCRTVGRCLRPLCAWPSQQLRHTGC